MPTLLQINVTANWGSTGKIAEQIGLTAMRHGWDSYIAYGRMMNPSKSKLIKIGSQKDVYMHYAASRFIDSEGLLSKKATQSLIGKIAQIKPTIVHLHNIHDHYLNYPLLFKYLASSNIPVIWTQHDNWAITGSCCYVPEGCEKWKVGCNECILRRGIKLDNSKRNYILKKDLFTSIKSMTIVPVSEWLGNLMQNSFLSRNKVQVIHNGIDIKTFAPNTNSSIRKRFFIGDKKIVLGVASEWSVRKGLSDLIKLSSFLPKEEYIILIVGKLLGAKAEQHEGGCEMVFIDRTQNITELVEIYSSAMVYVNPTYQDNYPTTNLEAMACGTPVITYDTGGSPEAVTNETGWVIEQNNIHGIAKIIKELSSMSKEERLIQRKKCRERAEKHFDKDICFNEYLRLYNSLI